MKTGINLSHNPGLLWASKVFSMFTLYTRVDIINLLLEKKGLTVNQICAEMKHSQPDISHNLALLSNYKILTRKKVGRTVYYAVDEEKIEKILKAAEELSKM